MSVTFIGKSPVITGGINGSSSRQPIENSYAWCSNLINSPAPKTSVVQTQIKNCEMIYPPLSEEVKEFNTYLLAGLLLCCAFVVIVGILDCIFKKEKKNA